MAAKKWDKAALREQFLQGVKEGSWVSLGDFQRKVCNPMGMPDGTFRVMTTGGKWRELMRPILGEKAYEQRLTEAAGARARVTQDLEKSADLAGRILGTIEQDLNAGKAMNPAEKDKSASAIEKMQRVLLLALDKATIIVDGAPTVVVKISRENSPYRPLRRAGPEIPRLDVADSGPSREASDSVRGAEDTQDRPPAEVDDIKDVAIALPGGGVVHSALPDAGETGGVAEDTGHPPAPESQDNRGEDERD